MNELRKLLEERIQHAQKEVDQLTDDFKFDLVRALEGAHSAFRLAARIEVCQQVLLNVKRGMTSEAIRNDVISRAGFLGRLPEDGATSTARLMNQYRLAELSYLIYCGKW